VCKEGRVCKERRGGRLALSTYLGEERVRKGHSDGCGGEVESGVVCACVCGVCVRWRCVREACVSGLKFACADSAWVSDAATRAGNNDGGRRGYVRMHRRQRLQDLAHFAHGFSQ
jgi:hypothetical protein